MAPRKELHWLEDIKISIAEIETHPQYARGRSAFNEDKYFRGWCYLQLMRISEACVRLADDFDYKSRYPDALPWRSVRAERMILVHKYWSIDDDIIWDTIETDLPQLKQLVDGWTSDLPKAD